MYGLANGLKGLLPNRSDVGVGGGTLVAPGVEVCDASVGCASFVTALSISSSESSTVGGPGGTTAGDADGAPDDDERQEGRGRDGGWRERLS